MTEPQIYMTKKSGTIAPDKSLSLKFTLKEPSPIYVYATVKPTDRETAPREISRVVELFNPKVHLVEKVIDDTPGTMTPMSYQPVGTDVGDQRNWTAKVTNTYSEDVSEHVTLEVFFPGDANLCEDAVEKT